VLTGWPAPLDDCASWPKVLANSDWAELPAEDEAAALPAQLARVLSGVTLSISAPVKIAIMAFFTTSRSTSAPSGM
jgi:hypothetical protein